ncbi:hypothetical protein G6F50_018202 [Rhizopus delemar]|uniref:Uncharacterized protein n=1 Tax=Rhizopus delemar TaxID=936053 RepID=A0A9P7BZJ1_9FUNG|nr:hypothetical protein G6F50_018202 [Rhizopus delemar]
MLGLRHAGVQDAGGFAGAHDTGDGLVDCLQDLGVFRLAQITHAGRQVGRADEGAVHAVYRQDLVQRVNAGRRFDLHQHAHLVVGAVQIVGDTVPAR